MGVWRSFPGSGGNGRVVVGFLGDPVLTKSDEHQQQYNILRRWALEHCCALSSGMIWRKTFTGGSMASKTHDAPPACFRAWAALIDGAASVLDAAYVDVLRQQGRSLVFIHTLPDKAEIQALFPPASR
jgi:hypothetical protein